jgi:ornithine cyclodeaminase
MDTVILSGRDVRELLPMGDCIEAMAEVLAALSDGRARQPLRSVEPVTEPGGGGNGVLASMPALWPEAGAMSVKVLSVFPENLDTDLPAHQGAVALFDTSNGRLRALVDAAGLTAVRTAAVSGLATRLLASEDADDLAILGSGTQAHAHLEAMLAVRPIRRVRVWSRRAERADAFVAAWAGRTDAAVTASPAAKDAVSGASVVCTVTGSATPVLEGRWLSPGAHVNAVGAVGAARRELDADAVARSRVFVDRRQSADAEAGEIVMAMAEGRIDAMHVAGELGEVVLGSLPGRTAPEEITLFRGLGLAVEDLAAARLVAARADARGVGLRVELGGNHRGR